MYENRIFCRIIFNTLILALLLICHLTILAQENTNTRRSGRKKVTIHRHEELETRTPLPKNEKPAVKLNHQRQIISPQKSMMNNMTPEQYQELVQKRLKKSEREKKLELRKQYLQSLMGTNEYEHMVAKANKQKRRLRTKQNQAKFQQEHRNFSKLQNNLDPKKITPNPDIPKIIEQPSYKKLITSPKKLNNTPRKMSSKK